jgi:hypothetical protein
VKSVLRIQTYQFRFLDHVDQCANLENLYPNVSTFQIHLW